MSTEEIVLPDDLFQRAVSAAKMRGQSLESFIQEAIRFSFESGSVEMPKAASMNKPASVSEQLARLIYFYGSPKAAAKATGLPVGYFYPLRNCHFLRVTVAQQYRHLLSRAIAELDGVFEIKMSVESRKKAEEVATAQGLSVRELVQAEVEDFFNRTETTVSCSIDLSNVDLSTLEGCEKAIRDLLEANPALADEAFHG